MPATAYIGLGSNLGERADNLRRALDALGQSGKVQVTRVSSFHETAPIGGPADQGPYLNAVAEVQTDLPPPELLRLLLSIEDRLGRVRTMHHGPRSIDLDLLLYDQQVGHWREPPLQLPHPRLHERLFVLKPLAEIKPALRHPLLNRTAAELLAVLEGKAARELSGLRALVTGSTSGIGRAIALELAAAGADVIVHGRRSAERAAEVTALCQQHQVRARCLMADLADEAALGQFVTEAWQAWDGLDIWVNNAGADTLTGAAAHWPFERKLAELWAVDVRATMLLSRRVGGLMKQRGRGVLLTMGWDQAATGMEGDSGQLFGAVKGAIMAFTKSLALSLAPEVRINCIAPGWIRTAWGETASHVWQDRVLRETPLKRWGTPQDIAHAARWLASPAAEFLTGQVINVNGGVVR